jgi:hypothetical protein
MATIAIPAILGALSLASKFFEKKPSTQKFDLLSKKQGSLQDKITNYLSQQFGEGSIFSQGQDYLSKLLSGNEEFQNQFEQPLIDQFNKQIVPQLAGRFGGAGALSSSYFTKALGGAATDLQTRLGALRGNMQLQGAQQALGLPQSFLSSAFQPRFSTGIQGGNPGPLAQGLAPILQGFGNNYGELLAGKAFGGES